MVNVFLSNQGNSAWSNWQAKWTFGGNQRITNLCNGNLSQNGQAVTVQNAGWNGNVQPSATVGFGFQATYSGSNSAPTMLTVNGQPCDLSVSIQAANSPTLYLPNINN